MIIEFKGMRPDVEKATFIADSATLSGDIHLAENTSVWFGASVRAEVASITIGRDSNVQDNAMLHADYDLPITIGERVSVGHNAIVHGATIEDDVIVGMHATVMNGAHVGRGSIIAAGALVKEHAVIPERSLVAGVPGVVKRAFTEEELQRQKKNAAVYTDDASEYARQRQNCRLASFGAVGFAANTASHRSPGAEWASFSTSSNRMIVSLRRFRTEVALFRLSYLS